VNTVLRTLFVWLLLLVLPFQGVAAARMLPSVGAAQSTASAPAASVAKSCHAMHMAASGHHQGEHRDKHQDKHNSACAGCCIAAAPLPAPLLPPALSPSSWAIPFRAGHVPSVDPVLPERPPRPLVA
jgi:hypothetical protein